jgi:hypothetical protein
MNNYLNYLLGYITYDDYVTNILYKSYDNINCDTKSSYWYLFYNYIYNKYYSYDYK